MRLHRLEIEAIGPFAAAQSVDFDALSASGIFLLEGATGVGKTSVLDAITFALFGGVSLRGGGDGGRMHSHFSDPHQTPRVVLEFSVAGVRYRVVRTPRFERPKRRGTGTVSVPPTVSLSRSTAQRWVEVTHDAEEAGTAVSELLGLNRDQFAQVVALPQGQFARFLEADEAHRRELLTRLFGTQLFDRVTDSVEARARAARAELAASQEQLVGMLAASLEAGGLDPQAGTRDDQPAPVDLARLREHAAALEASHDASLAEAGAAQRELRLATAELAEAATRAERLSRLVELLAALESHEATRPNRDGAARQVEAAQRAQAIAAVVEQMRVLSVECERAGSAVERQSSTAARVLGRGDLPDVVAAELGTSGAGPADPGSCAPPGGQTDGVRVADWVSRALAGAATEPARLEGLASLLRDQSARLAPLAELEQSLADLSEVLESEREQRARVLSELDDARRGAGSLPGLLAQVAELLPVVCSQAGAEPALAREVQLWRDRAAAARRCAELEAQLVDLQGRASLAVDRHQAAVDRHQDLQEQRIAGMAAELSAALVPGDPCPVCGSAEHPGRVSADPVRVSRRDCDRAARDRDVAATERSALEAQVAGLRERLAGQRAAAGALDLAESLGKAEQAELARQAAASAGQVAEDLIACQAAWSGELERVERCCAELVERAAALAERVDGLGHDLEESRARVAASRAGWPSVQARMTGLSRAAVEVSVLIERVREHAVLVDRAGEVAAIASAQAVAAGFDSVDQVLGALLQPADLARMSSEVQAWDREALRLAGMLAADDLAGISPAEHDEVHDRHARARRNHEDLSARCEQAATAVQSTARMAQRFAQRLADYTRACERHEQLLAASEDLFELDRMMRGLDPRKRMTLTAFVLRSWFDRVVAAANVRLGAMSAARYQLLRAEVGEARRERVGLGLSILDRHTGQQRSTRSLSGGETFYTSLALALGLSDVVAAEAGGAMLETLFIDEGFGSLDPDTLDEVMAVIEDLRGNGRVVGIVSHVTELKERIPERLEVRRVRPEGPSRLAVIA